MNQSQKNAIRAARLKRLREASEHKVATTSHFVPETLDNIPAFMSDSYISLGDGNYRTSPGRRGM